jgi:hypothetical protein
MLNDFRNLLGSSFLDRSAGVICRYPVPRYLLDFRSQLGIDQDLTAAVARVFKAATYIP